MKKVAEKNWGPCTLTSKDAISQVNYVKRDRIICIDFLLADKANCLFYYVVENLHYLLNAFQNRVKASGGNNHREKPKG